MVVDTASCRYLFKIRSYIARAQTVFNGYHYESYFKDINFL